MAGYLGAIPVPQATQNRESFTCSANQTSFATAGYTQNFVDAFLNGVRLNTADFTATNGSDIVLASGAAENDVLDVISYATFEVNAQTFTGTTTLTDVVAASLDISGAVDIAGTTNLDVVDIDGTVNIAAATTIATNNKIQFRDTAIHISSPADGDLAIAADDEIDITSTLIDINGAVDMSSTLGVTGVVTANAGVVVDEMTLDADTLTATDTFTIDAAGIITLDSAFSSGTTGGIIRLSDAGTQFGDLYEDSSNFLIASAQVDKDIIFKGNDNGGIITALTLNMSDAGSATFNHDIFLPNAGRLYFTSTSGFSPRISNDTTTTTLSFFTNNTERMSIVSGGDVTVKTGNLVIGTAGKGIDFAAQTQSSSGTTGGELLDHYEEGTWVPVIQDASSGAVATMNTGAGNLGAYTRVGRNVSVYAHVVVSSLGDCTGPIRLLGLPFTNINSQSGRSGISCGLGQQLNITAGHVVSGYVELNQAFIELNIWDDAAGTTSLTAEELSANGVFFFGATYPAA